MFMLNISCRSLNIRLNTNREEKGADHLWQRVRDWKWIGSFLYTSCSNHLGLALSQRQKSLYNWLKRSLELFEKIWFVMTTWHCLCQLRPTICLNHPMIISNMSVVRACCEWNLSKSKVTFARINVFCPCIVKIFTSCFGPSTSVINILSVLRN